MGKRKRKKAKRKDWAPLSLVPADRYERENALLKHENKTLRVALKEFLKVTDK